MSGYVGEVLKSRFAAAVVCAMVSNGALAEEPEDKPFPENPPLSVLLERLPVSTVPVPWMGESLVARYDESQIDKDKTMPSVREQYAKWCKANGGRIFQPTTGNCAPLSKGLACGVGEIQWPGLGTDFERGLKDAAAGTSDTVRVAWPRASWFISNRLLYNALFNKGPAETAVVGGLQRCMVGRAKLLGAMAFVSINDNSDLIFLEPQAYEHIAARGAERAKEEAEKAKSKQAAEIAALPPGSPVSHKRSGDRGIIVEMKPPLAQVQWDKLNGTKAIEWVPLGELMRGMSR